jgi:hypothetical protein
MTANDPALIKEMFTGRKNEPDDDINVSVDQIDKVVAAIEEGLDYPESEHIRLCRIPADATVP